MDTSVVHSSSEKATRMLGSVRRWFKKKFLSPMSEEEFDRRREELLKEAPLPSFWLFGKTGSGKTSIIKFLTGAESATIGTGFRPETKFARRYDYPSPETPLVQFLDTRGLGEIHYDPAEEIQEFAAQTHLMLVPVRIKDSALESVIEPLKKIRASKPHRPVILVLTCLHQVCPEHPDPYPFTNTPLPEGIPDALREAIQTQLDRFKGLYDACVPVDLTPLEEGFEDPNYGGERLQEAMLEHLPAAYRQTFLQLDDVMGSLRNLRESEVMPIIMTASTMAATAAAVPLPWVDLPVVAGIQSNLIRQLAKCYDQELDWQDFLATAGAVSGPLVLRQLLREPLKIIPGVGMAANAALAFASTYGLGKACCWYYGERQAGNAPSTEELQRVLKAEMDVARKLWKRTEP